LRYARPRQCFQHPVSTRSTPAIEFRRSH